MEFSNVYLLVQLLSIYRFSVDIYIYPAFENFRQMLFNDASEPGLILLVEPGDIWYGSYLDTGKDALLKVDRCYSHAILAYGVNMHRIAI